MMHTRQKTTKWDGQGKGTTLGHKIMLQTIILLGPLPAYFFLLFVAITYYLKDKQAVLAICDFRKHIGFKKATPMDCMRHFYSFGVSFIDRISFLIINKSPFRYTYNNENIITNALENGKGAILLSAHIGNWEVASNLFVDRYPNTKVNIIMLDNERQELQETIKVALDKRRINIIGVDPLGHGLDLIIAVKKALSNNELICLHGDRVLSSQEAISLNFFGKKALFPKGPFEIAAITSAPLIPVFILKKGIFVYEFTAYKPIDFSGITRQNRANKITNAMNEFIKTIEKIVQKRPFQWYNFYMFWENNRGGN